MALELHIPPCIHGPPHNLHAPPPEKPLRIQIEGPLTSIQKLLPDISWYTEDLSVIFPQPAGPELAKLTFQRLYGQAPRPHVAEDMVVRDEYLGWIVRTRQIDYYGVTFDHLVPNNDHDPDVLQINLIEMDDDDGAYAKENLLFKIDPAEYSSKKVLAVPRCCQKRKGTQDRQRINEAVFERDRESLERLKTLGSNFP